jgi:hypothetical protein
MADAAQYAFLRNDRRKHAERPRGRNHATGIIGYWSFIGRYIRRRVTGTARRAALSVALMAGSDKPAALRLAAMDDAPREAAAARTHRTLGWLLFLTLSAASLPVLLLFGPGVFWSAEAWLLWSMPALSCGLIGLRGPWRSRNWAPWAFRVSQVLLGLILLGLSAYAVILGDVGKYETINSDVKETAGLAGLTASSGPVAILVPLLIVSLHIPLRNIAFKTIKIGNIFTLSNVYIVLLWHLYLYL